MKKVSLLWGTLYLVPEYMFKKDFSFFGYFDPDFDDPDFDDPDFDDPDFHDPDFHDPNFDDLDFDDPDFDENSRQLSYITRSF